MWVVGHVVWKETVGVGNSENMDNPNDNSFCRTARQKSKGTLAGEDGERPWFLSGQKEKDCAGGWEGGRLLQKEDS